MALYGMSQIFAVKFARCPLTFLFFKTFGHPNLNQATETHSNRPDEACALVTAESFIQ